MIGLYLFGDKIANPQDMSAYFVMVALTAATGFVDIMMNVFFGFSAYYCVDKTKPTAVVQSQIQMTKVNTSNSKIEVQPSKEEEAPSKKAPSQVKD